MSVCLLRILMDIAGFKLKSLDLKLSPGKRSQDFNATYCNIAGHMLCTFDHPVAKCCHLSEADIFNTQHVSTRHNKVAKCTQQVAHNSVVICCIEML